ncbi:phosphoribosylamine--glycine ligase [Treponema sp. HNW]|uniref:phosphoribosylamine--glycine ligase n=1 Tax=Treponema sp. HNW TaxID=3116654 RepID=UPI003D0AB6E8
MLIGSGGREHALCWALSKSDEVSEIVCISGNAGTACEPKAVNIPLPQEIQAVPETATFFADIARTHKIDFALIGPEAPLCAGLADELWKYGIPVVGPKKTAAQLEGSKDFAKNFMKKYGIACADSVTVTNTIDAKMYIEQRDSPIVIKADGLAGGKGVIVAATRQEAMQAVQSFMEKRIFGEAGKRIVLEEYLRGSEISILAAVSVTPKTASTGKAAIIPFVPARDHKRLRDGAKGPNTGGMGAIAPVPDISPETMEAFSRTILEPTLRGLIAEGFDYRGFIFFGIMLTDSGPKLLEYNVRLGDPETQAVLPLLDCDFARLCTAILDQNNEGLLRHFEIRHKKGSVCAPVVVSGGYPDLYKTGYEIDIRTPYSILRKVSAVLQKTQNQEPKPGRNSVKLFISGAEAVKAEEEAEKLRICEKKLITSGGRVLCVSAFASEDECKEAGKEDTLGLAREKAYHALKRIRFKDMFYRKDIGLAGAADSEDI